MKEQKRCLKEEITSLENYFPSPDENVVSLATEAKLCLCSLHLSIIASRVTTELDSIEDVLKSQLVDAIGKHPEPEDFSKYMLFHNSKLFKAEYHLFRFTTVLDSLIITPMEHFLYALKKRQSKQYAEKQIEVMPSNFQSIQQPLWNSLVTALCIRG
jgi:hypothetical protein